MQLVNVVPLSQSPIVREACHASGLRQMGRLRVGRIQLDTMGQHHVEQPGIVEAMVAYLSLDIETNQVHDVSSEFMNLSRSAKSLLLYKRYTQWELLWIYLNTFEYICSTLLKPLFSINAIHIYAW